MTGYSEGFLITTNGNKINPEILANYMHSLVNMFFKILPLKEDGESSLGTYIKSLQIELIGCSDLIVAIHNDSSFLTLISILQYMLDHPEISVSECKREVFKAISICNKLKARYSTSSLEERGERE